MGAQSADWRRNVHTDSAAATTSASDADGNDAPGQERRGKGETTKITAADKGTALLEQVVGMSDSFEEQILQLFEVNGRNLFHSSVGLTGCRLRSSNDPRRLRSLRGSTSSMS